jgi:hypothetical protein
MPDLDFDVVHTPESVLVRVYYRDVRDALVPLAEVTLARSADFPGLYDSFRREHGWPTVEQVENELLHRLTGKTSDQVGQTEKERESTASRHMAEFFKTWLVLRGRGQVLRLEQSDNA